MKRFILLACAALAVLALGATAVSASTKVTGKTDSTKVTGKTDVCHRTGNGSFHVINVSVNAVPAHIAHGDGLPGGEVPGLPGSRFGANCGIVVVASCAAIRALEPTAGDGNYTIFAGRAFTVYCHDMAGTPKEYLTLVNTASTANFSQYTAGGASPGTNVRTSYTRVRLDPATLVIDTNDQTFATSTGSLTHARGGQVTSMPYGSAMSCQGGPTGIGNVDLTGTPFTVASTFSVAGFNATGSVVPSSAGQVVGLTGGGSCGWASLTGSFNPFNQNGLPMQLAFLASTFGASTTTRDTTPRRSRFATQRHRLRELLALPTR
jgi:hypothetical protein